jgi:hypothetical protein
MTSQQRERPVPQTDAQLYTENALSYARRGVFAEIKPESPSWASWRAYFREINHRTMLNVVQAHETRTWLGKTGMMVPTEWPRDFDDRAPTLPPTPSGRGFSESDARRAEVVRKLLNSWRR